MVHFTALPRIITPQTRMGPRVDLRTDQGGIMGAGSSWIPVPARKETIYDITVAWNMTGALKRMSAVWTYGEGQTATRRGPASDIVTTYYGVGPLRSHTSPSNPGFGVYWLGEPTLFNVTELSTVIEGLFTRMAAFFEDPGTTYRISIRKSTAPAWGGTAMMSCFMLEWSDSIKLLDPQAEVFHLLAHEIVHNWTVMQPADVDGGEEDPDSAWYTEGARTRSPSVIFGYLSMFQAQLSIMLACCHSGWDYMGQIDW